MQVQDVGISADVGWCADRLLMTQRLPFIYLYNREVLVLARELGHAKLCLVHLVFELLKKAELLLLCHTREFIE